MDRAEMIRVVEGERVAHLATASAKGEPHVVAICFALERDVLYFAVDAKPKRTRDLKRLRNIESNPSVAVLFDHYEEDWRRLWWVRIDGTARILDGGAAMERAIDLLAMRYPQYMAARPEGPAVEISIQRVTGWSAS